jgi:hypothetical protein
MKPGDLLFPNEYMIQNGDNRIIFILEVFERDVRLETQYKVLFSDGFINELGHSTITNLFKKIES